MAKRRGVCADGYLVPSAAASRMRELIDEHERDLAEKLSDQMRGEPNYREVRDDAGLRPLRFHDLRHTFGSLAVDGGASLVQVQAWMGHADIGTTMRCLHSKRRTGDAALLGAAFLDR